MVDGWLIADIIIQDLSFLGNRYVIAGVIILTSLLIAYLGRFVVAKYMKEWIGKLKVRGSRRLTDATLTFFSWFIAISGIYLAIRYLNIFAEYSKFLDGAYVVLVALLVVKFVIRATNIFVPIWLKSEDKEVPAVISKIIIVFVYAIAILILLDHFGVAISPLIATLGLGGLAIGLALQNTLANFFAGIYLISDKSVDVGDLVQLDKDTIGTVTDISWRATKLETWQNDILIIPNSKLADTLVINKNLKGTEYKFSIPCGVDYKSDLKKVEKVALDVAKNVQNTVEGADDKYTPTVRFKEFGESNIMFSVVLRAKSYSTHFLLKHEFVKQLKARFDKEKIEISWPVVKVYRMK